MGLLESNGLNVGSWTPPVPISTRKTTQTNIDVPRMVRSLEQLDSTPWKPWNTVGLALKNESPDLFWLWEWWSKRSPNSKGCDLRAEWDKLNPNGSVTLGTIYYLGEPQTENPFEANYYGEADLEAADFHVDFLVDGMVIEGQNGLFVGQEKTLKTTLSHKMGICLAHGLPFMGRNVEQRVTALFSGESGDATMQETNKRIRSALGVEADNEAFIYCPTLPYFDSSMTHFQEFLKAHDVQVAIVDPAYQCINGEQANNVFQMGQQLKRFSDSCLDIGVTPILCHHLIKNTGDNFTLRDMAWAGFREWCRQWVALDRRSDYVEGSGVHDLRMRWGGSAGHGGKLLLTIREGIYPNRFWELDYQTEVESAVAKRDSQFSEDVEKVRAVLTQPMCQNPLRDAAGIKSSRWPETLNRMLKEGIVEPATEGTRPKYKLVEKL